MTMKQTTGETNSAGVRISVAALRGDARDAQLLAAGEHFEPHRLLGAHPHRADGSDGAIVRGFHPDAVRAECILEDGTKTSMEPLGDGLFAVFLPSPRLPPRYRLRFHFADGACFEHGDPYRFWPSVGEVDLYLFGEGNHRRLWEVLGAHPRTVDGVEGTSFAVWAPNARRVSLVGPFNSWDGRLFPMRSLGSSGVWELFVPGVGIGALYKYELKTADGAIRIKADPYCQAMELPPATASAVTSSDHQWGDADYMRRRAEQDITRSPVSIYEVHLGSWQRIPEQGYRSLSYREAAPALVAHCKRLGFSHIELMPLAEHAFYGSWGYQVTGYFAPTARYGNPDDLRWFVDYCHQHGIGIIMDWVPAHFPKDDFALRRFDGTALYEHEDARRGEHPDWGTLIFNYGRPEVRNFLVSNALYWLQEFHIDGLRVDAVASMLYLDYSRPEGQWLPNPYGGRENIEAIELLRATNEIIRQEVPGAFTIAEESTAWGGVTRRAADGGLGFTFKWNMGWMHDTLEYFKKEPVHRKHHQDQLTFAMIYEYHERFINSISHDEVVHGKGALVSKLPGDWWQKLANLRLLVTYQYVRPGKQLVFMGTELAQDGEWNHDSSIDWHVQELPDRQKLLRFFERLGQFYLQTPALWRSDPQPESFEWIDAGDRENSVLSFVRRDGHDHVVVVMNMTPVPRDDYRIGAPSAGRYVELFSSDAPELGGSAYETVKSVQTEPISVHGRAQSISLRLPPLGVIVLGPQEA
jgi:1,4-alpha-glucan branching enzyme